MLPTACLLPALSTQPCGQAISVHRATPVDVQVLWLSKGKGRRGGGREREREDEREGEREREEERRRERESSEGGEREREAMTTSFNLLTPHTHQLLQPSAAMKVCPGLYILPSCPVHMVVTGSTQDQPQPLEQQS